MNKDQGNYYRMFLNTQEFLDNQSTVWTAVPRIVSYKNELDELISRIDEKDEEAHTNVSVSDRKNKLKLALGQKIAALSGALQVFAIEQNEPDRAKSMQLTKSDVERAKEQELSASVSILLSYAEQNLAALAEYGVTADQVTEISTSLEEFKGLVGQPRTILNQKFVALSSLEQLVDETNALLNNKLDKIMLMFSDSHPEFYEGYIRARTIVNR